MDGDDLELLDGSNVIGFSMLTWSYKILKKDKVLIKKKEIFYSYFFHISYKKTLFPNFFDLEKSSEFNLHIIYVIFA